jgi:hypothetical protein
VPLEPRVVFENLSQHLARFCASSDAEVEDHLFDRKEIPLPTPGSNVSHNVLRDIKEQIRETVSAFANTNPEGGLLVIGISKTGCLVGINHLTDSQRNELSNIGQPTHRRAAGSLDR